ncbi:phage head spike fiber domain-containing protein, partial [Halomonas elongata]|uniref:phage head spike fiber domain-containing protein n=1 Tax=Halomonas elongata TaxID=2746 RepID=UPI00186B5AE7
MAELDPALQDEINELQTRHTGLVDAVRNYSGGSIAQATNDLLAAQAQTESTIDEREAALLGLIQRSTTKPVPSLLSDFATRTYMAGVRRLEHGIGVHDMWNVSRSSVRWVWGPNGKLVEVASGQPAYAYDPETGDPLGISIDPTRTNDLSDSSGMSDFGAQRHTRTLTTDIECPTGDNVFAIERTETGSLYGIIQQGKEYQAGDTVSFSYLIHPNGLDDILNGVIRIWSGPNRIMDSDVYVPIDETAQPLPGGWYGVHATVVADKAGFSGASYNISHVGNIGDIFYISSPQLELGDVTSYIPTSGSPVTRDADVVRRTLGDEYNPNGFSVYADAQQRSDIGSVFFLNSGGLSNSMRVG